MRDWRATATEAEIRDDYEIRKRRGLLGPGPQVLIREFAWTPAGSEVRCGCGCGSTDLEVRDVGERARLGLSLTEAQERELTRRVVGPRQIFGIALRFGVPGRYTDKATRAVREEFIYPGAVDGWLAAMGRDHPIELRLAHEDVRVGVTDWLHADDYALWMLATVEPGPEGDAMLAAAARGELALSTATLCRDALPGRGRVERRTIDALREISLTANPAFEGCLIVAVAGQPLYLAGADDVVAEAEAIARDAAGRRAGRSLGDLLAEADAALRAAGRGPLMAGRPEDRRAAEQSRARANVDDAVREIYAWAIDLKHAVRRARVLRSEWYGYRTRVRPPGLTDEWRAARDRVAYLATGVAAWAGYDLAAVEAALATFDVSLSDVRDAQRV